MKKKIIFLPGLFTGENEKLYKEIKKYFDKYFDFTSFQYSDEKRTMDFSIKKTKEKLSSLLEEKENKDAIFIGHSMAGPILSEFFIDNKLNNKLILLDPSVLPIPKHLHKDVYKERDNKNYLIWENEEDLKEISEDFKDEYLENKQDYSKLIKKNTLIFFSNLKIVKEYLGNEFNKTYSNLNIINIEDTDHYFDKKEKEIIEQIKYFIKN